ncbi:MAG: ATP-binding protein [Acidimicrobiales bacterium]
MMNEGAPDGALWLGLDRSSFVATACVEQAQMLRVLADAGGLQDHLQRAAATAGTDATAAAALERLENFQREHVGQDRVNSTKPLRLATESVAVALGNLESARCTHQEYLDRLQQVDQLRREAELTSEKLRLHEAAAAAELASRLVQRQTRAQELYAIYEDTAPPSVADDDALANQATAALAAWRSLSPETPPPARMSAEVQAELDALPEAPDGDIEVHSTVQQAADRAREAQVRLRSHEEMPPSKGDEESEVDADENELLDLARILEAPLLTVPEPVVAEEQAARAAATNASGHNRLVRILLVIGAAAALVGAGLLGVNPVLGAVVLAVGIALLILAALRRRSGDEVIVARRLAEAQAVLAAEQQKVTEAVELQTRSTARCSQLGLSPDPSRLRRLAVAHAQAERQEQDRQRWIEERTRLQTGLLTAIEDLAAALTARGEAADANLSDEVFEAMDRYREECRTRDAQAREAGRRTLLQRELESSRSAELRVEQDEEARAEANQRLFAATQACGLPANEPAACADALQAWQAARGGTLSELSRAQHEWAELQALLDGGTLGDLAQTVVAAVATREELSDGLNPQQLAAVDYAAAADRLPELRERVAETANIAAHMEGELRQFLGTVPSVSESEEEANAAATELARVKELKETLELARDFLSEAQTRVHRSIAPVLALTVRQWLPKVTGGRYIDVNVDPTTLRVDVCGPSRRWRNAERLSYGTAEQIYLLLRLALADHLTAGHDTCPLILDDVTCTRISAVLRTYCSSFDRCPRSAR